MPPKAWRVATPQKVTTRTTSPAPPPQPLAGLSDDFNKAAYSSSSKGSLPVTHASFPQQPTSVLSLLKHT